MAEKITPYFPRKMKREKSKQAMMAAYSNIVLYNKRPARNFVRGEPDFFFQKSSTMY